ncbi:hypothetical protein ABID29_001393 [Streptococcus rupicaprae]|uniref:DUF1033 family protein n=1 Tax=Streptococcus rupicaprae TaxID=759619 RepID=A0ABV2FIA4_9STRE
MYQVIKLYGDFEPWWFLEGWQEDIVMCQNFDDYGQAERLYQKEWQQLRQVLPQHEERTDKMSVFWDPAEQRWCEECDEFLQQYHSLLLLEHHEMVTWLPQQAVGGSKRVKACHLKKAE